MLILNTKFLLRNSVWLIFTIITLAGCSDSTSDPGGTTNSAGGSMSTPLNTFTDSESVNERFGTRTSRELSPQVEEATRAAVIAALNNFSFDVHRAIATEKPNEGSVESGFSAALALLLSSAATGGDTNAALISLLGMDALSEDEVHEAVNELSLMLESRANDDLILHTANRVFVKPGLDLQTPFLDRATADYGAPVTEADFSGAPEEVANEVNEWVSTQTNEFIPSIIERFDKSTVFAILNAIFLDAKWQDTYQSVDEQPFNSISGTPASVMSFGGRSVLPRLVSDDLTALEIPYGGSELAMLILMPNKLDEFEALLDGDKLNEIVNSLENSDVQFTVPNWQQSSELDLVQVLSPLGLPSNPWDFERLVNQGISLDVLARQRAKIEVDENGTRAAAVTLVSGITSVPESVVINQPFVYVLRDRTTGVVLFSGRVVAP